MTSPRFDADPKPDLAILGHSGLAIDHCALHFGAAADRVDDALELGQEAVAGILYDPATVFGDLRVNKRLAMRLEAVVRALLIRSHQPGITGHIGSENRGETAGSGHCSPAAIKFSNKFYPEIVSEPIRDPAQNSVRFGVTGGRGLADAERQFWIVS